MLPVFPLNEIEEVLPEQMVEGVAVAVPLTESGLTVTVTVFEF